jgi:hypothetical protein
MEWPVEPIPVHDHLYFRVHQMYIRSDGIAPAAFTNRPAGGESMSVDWARYATPEETRGRARKPIENAVVQFVAERVRRGAWTASRTFTRRPNGKPFTCQCDWGKDARSTNTSGPNLSAYNPSPTKSSGTAIFRFLNTRSGQPRVCAGWGTPVLKVFGSLSIGPKKPRT